MSDEGRMARMKERLASLHDAPNALRLATQSAWRGRERGLAVVAGVFLASLVITTVLSYGVGLSQIFFQESLETEVYDAKAWSKLTPNCRAMLTDWHIWRVPSPAPKPATVEALPTTAARTRGLEHPGILSVRVSNALAGF